MDPSLTSGGIIATTGIGTVFFALVTLIAVVSAMARLLRESPAGGAAADSPGSPVAETSASAGEPALATPETATHEPDFQQIALSAYAYHRRSTTRVKSAAPPTSWEVAGRMRELNQRHLNPRQIRN